MINPEEIEYKIEIKENEMWVHNSLPKIIEFLPQELQDKKDVNSVCNSVEADDIKQ